MVTPQSKEKASRYGETVAEKENHIFFWLDYFSLRQCTNDFDVHMILAVIKKIGCLVASIDSEHLYTKRSFCILEAYAAVAEEETTLMCHYAVPGKRGTRGSMGGGGLFVACAGVWGLNGKPCRPL